MHQLKDESKVQGSLRLLASAIALCISAPSWAQETTPTEADEQEVAPQAGSTEPVPWALKDIATAATRNSAVPPLSQNLESERMIMLTLSVDHQLFMKAYNDYENIVPEAAGELPVPESTYAHAFTYVGYFDPKLCYGYADGQFKAIGNANAANYCVDGDSDGGWSGNFLNWATMTRMDLVRHVLYGGYRSVDEAPIATTAARTVLERAYLPQDAHSFAKYYPNTSGDLGKLTAGLPDTGCPEEGGSCEGFTFCSTTQPKEIKDGYSQDLDVIQLPPLLRAVKGNYSLWASNERYQCITADEVPLGGFDGAGFGKNNNNPAKTGINAFGAAPATSQVSDFNVRVEVCDADSDVHESFCQQYQAKSLKPVGILQKKGEDGDIKFGLLTGSYNSNKDFGALRKNISTFADEVNQDGTFVFPPLSVLAANPSTEPPMENSIIGNLNALRIVDYKFRSGGDSTEGGESDRGKWSGTYNDSYRRRSGTTTVDSGLGKCEWGWTSFENGNCRNWGNPFSELLAESYAYFAQQDKLTVDDDSDHGLIPGLTVAPWAVSESAAPAEEIETTDGTETAEQTKKLDFSCANMNVLGFNSSSASYDGEREADVGMFDMEVSDLLGAGTGTIPSLTSAIDGAELGRVVTEEGKEDKTVTYFVGRVGMTGDGQCTAKEVTSLGLVSGTCPEAPNSYGSYWGAGLAHFVHTNDLKPESSRKDTIATYGVTLAGAVPSISIPVPPTFDPQQAVKIIPACRNLAAGTGYKGNCSLVDFKPVQVIAEDAMRPGTYTGKYYIGWEDSEQGGDFDLDMGGTISFELTGESLFVYTNIIDETAVDRMEFGFIISGVDADGAYFPSVVAADPGNGIADDESTESNSCSALGGMRCYTVAENSHVQATKFTLGTATASAFLEPPLFYAAKWGSFQDSNDEPNGVIDAGEWNGSGYAEVTDPSRLEAQLFQILDNIIDKPVAGTGAAVATTALTGEGLILSTLFLPEVGAGNARVNWVGRLNGLFRADNENWEDSAEPYGVRTDADNVVRFRQLDSKTVIERYTASRDLFGNLLLSEPSDPVDYSELQPVWNARDQLAALSQDTIVDNRAYDATADKGRYVFTSVDKDTADAAGGATYTGNADVVEFVADNFDDKAPATVGLGKNNYRLLDAGNETNAANVVNFIRGQEGIEGFRNRTAVVNGEEKPWLLGDITHSTPALVARPKALYDSSRINDISYSNFRAQYANRRLVTYVGANDGMLHAFNGGFATVVENVVGEGDDAVTENAMAYVTDLPEGAVPPPAGTVKKHPLGAELWSYVPYNLLPHLKWLTDPNYRHVYYVDSNVNEFDVNIFPPSTTHPNGWGTIIVVGMRFGGTETTIDVGNGAAAKDERTMRSAYLIFDVTNPEVKPTLLGEISHPDLGYTIGDVDVVSFRDPDSNGSFEVAAGSLPKNQWYLTFGSGPTGISDASSDKTAKLFALDLNKLTKADPQVDIEVLPLPGATKSYVGGITAVDWNDDFDDDMLYFGTVGTGTAVGDPKGALMQATLAYDSTTGLSITASKLLSDVNLPFSREPLAIKESGSGGLWIYASSGKFLVNGDLDDAVDNKAFGVRVNRNPDAWITTTSVESLALRDVTGLTVETAVVRDEDGAIVDRRFTVIDGMTEFTPAAISEDIRTNYSGWSRRFSAGELSDTRPFFSGSTLGVTTFLPSVAGCSPTGRSRLYILNMFNGLPQTEAAAFVLHNPAGNTLTDRRGAAEGELGAYTEIQSKVNDVSEDGVPVLPGSDGSFQPALPEMPAGIPIRRSWREVPLDDLNL